jgi:hypothetical protein
LAGQPHDRAFRLLALRPESGVYPIVSINLSAVIFFVPSSSKISLFKSNSPFPVTNHITMGKRSHGDAKGAEKKPNGPSHAKIPILASDKAVDPSLALLFASSVCI